MASRETTSTTASSATPVLSFVAWMLTGTAGALGLVSLGPILLGPAVILGGVLLSRATARQWRSGLPAGAGLVFLYVADRQRHGPGTRCWHTAAASGCDQSLNPFPWLVLAVLLLAWALVTTRTRASTPRGQSPAPR